MADLSHLAVSGVELTLRVTPKARLNQVRQDETGAIRVLVTTAPEDGKANAAVLKLLAKSLGVAQSRLSLIRGAKSRDKTVRLD